MAGPALVPLLRDCAMATLRSGLVSLEDPSRQTLLIEPEMAGMLVLLPDEQILASHEREDGRIELTIGPRGKRRSLSFSWSWLGFALAGTALGCVLAEAIRYLHIF